MTTNTSSSSNCNGILEQLEDYIRFKINVINGLMDLRTNEPDNKCKEAFEDVIKTFSEVDELVDTLTDKVEKDKSLVKYIHSILESNKLQMENLIKLSQILSEKGDVPTDNFNDVKSESHDQINIKNKNNLNSNINNKIETYKQVKKAKI